MTYVDVRLAGCTGCSDFVVGNDMPGCARGIDDVSDCSVYPQTVGEYDPRRLALQNDRLFEALLAIADHEMGGLELLEGTEGLMSHYFSVVSSRTGFSVQFIALIWEQYVRGLRAM